MTGFPKGTKMADENKEQEPENQVDLSGLGSFDFTPDWAKGKPADASRYARFEDREARRNPRALSILYLQSPVFSL